MNSNYYIYCVTAGMRENEDINIKGHEGKNISVVTYLDICAIVSKTALTHYESSLENLLCHESVINKAMENFTVLPLSFSTICKDQESVIKLLKKYYLQLKNNLIRVQGKVEMGIKIFYKLDYEKEYKIDKSHYNSPKEYMVQKYKWYLEKKRQDEAIVKIANQIHSALFIISVESCFSNPMKNNLIFNGAYLVDKSNVECFSEEVLRLKKRYLDYKIIYSGPWSPYHFVKIVKEGENNE